MKASTDNIGVLAQQVLEVFPQGAVGSPDSPQPMGISSQAMIYLLLKAVQELREQVLES